MTEAELQLYFAKEVMPLYVESAKSYAQLSAGALALTIVFKEKVLGEMGRMRVNVLLALSWLSFLFAIGASVYYQWVAVRLIQYYGNLAAGIEEVYFPFTVDWLWPGYAYGVMVTCFFAGAALLVVASGWRLLKGA